MLVVSMFYFPINFTFLPGPNTKNIMGAVGLVVCVALLLGKRSMFIPKSLLAVLFGASLVSIIGLFSVVYNRTPDMSYATYVVSAIIWLSGALAVTSLIKWLHGRLDISLVTQYLVAVCIYQCVAALLIDHFPAVRSIVDSLISQGQGLLQAMDRLYGIGASLDVAGSRFSAVLILLGGEMAKARSDERFADLSKQFASYLLIVFVGSMIARTTYVGAALGLLTMILMAWRPSLTIKKSTLKYAFGILIIIAIFTLIGVEMYNSNPRFKELIRFAFEGFFNLFENGEWSIASNEKLETMYVWPDNAKTWIIGDAYFNNPRGDINYLGHSTDQGFYMGTDVGWCRFIFYFGIVGLTAFSAYLTLCCKFAADKLPESRLVVWIVLLANFVVWFKVSTDLFPMMAILYCLGEFQPYCSDPEEDDDYLTDSPIL